MIHFDTMLRKQFATNKFASMTLRWVGFTTHDGNLIAACVCVYQTLKPIFKDWNFCHFLIVKKSVLVIAIIIQRTPSNTIPHVIIPYIGIFKQLLNSTTIKMWRPF